MDFGGHDLATAITPQDLIPGSVDQIDKTIEALVSVGVPATGVGDMLPTLDSDAWTGPAADAFHVAYSPQPPVWTSIGTGLTGLSDALKAWRDAVQYGQGQAWLAKGEWVQAQKLTDTAQASYNQLALAHTNLGLAAHLGIAQAPAPLPPFTDPGASLRQQAQQRLNTARASVAGAENIAIAAMAAAREALPTAPDAWHQFGDDFMDDTHTFTTQVGDVGKGAYHAVAGFVDTARALNPLDSENTAHPGQYALTMLSMAQGVGHDLTHPVDTLQSMANNASQELQHDPGQLIGSLLPNVAVGLATDGTGDLAAGAADAASAGTDEATSLAFAANDARGTALWDTHPVDPIDTHPLPSQAVTTNLPRLPGMGAASTDTTAGIEQAGVGLSSVERDLAGIQLHETLAGPDPQAVGLPQLQQRLAGADPRPGRPSLQDAPRADTSPAVARADEQAAAAVHAAGAGLRQVESDLAKIHIHSTDTVGPTGGNDYPATAGHRGLAGGPLHDAQQQWLHQVRAANPVAAKLSDDQLLAIDQYKTAAWQINKALRSGDPSQLAEVDAEIRAIASCLSRLPDYTGNVVRGIEVDPGRLRDTLIRYQPGTVVEEPAFTSADKRVPSVGNIEFYINSIHGKDISFLTDSDTGPQEVVFPPATRFSVTSRSFNPNTRTWEIRLKEIGQ